MGALQLCATALSDADHHVQSHCAPSVACPPGCQRQVVTGFYVDTASTPLPFTSLRRGS